MRLQIRIPTLIIHVQCFTKRSRSGESPYRSIPKRTLYQRNGTSSWTRETLQFWYLLDQWQNLSSCQMNTKRLSSRYSKTCHNTTFIWKFEEEDSKLAAHLDNVYLSSWVPQNALLADPRLSVFITHGGLGSTTELAHMGKPALLIPLFSDQTRNAHMLAKHGGGIVLKKSDLESPRKLADSLKTLLSDASFSRNAKRLAEMLLNQPISAKQLFIQHSEFAAR
ncbi:glycosyltransferase family 28 protein [Cooperia oncophora]